MKTVLKMKHNFLSLALLIFLGFLITSAAGSGAMNKESVANMGNPDSFEELMGGHQEECEKADEECLSRRATAEAHLDYIYTQHRKP